MIGGGEDVRNGADVVAFEVIDGGFVVSVDDAGGAKGAKGLGEGVDGELRPREAAVDAHAQRYGGVEMTARPVGCVGS